jgi:hypothetical protein
MFSNYFKCRVSGAKMYIAKNKDGDERMLSISFTYDFTAKLAENMGPRAVGILAALESDKEAKLSAKTVGIKIDAKSVAGRVKYKGKKVHAFDGATALAVRAAAATADAASPTLVLKVSLSLEADGTDFAREFLDQPIELRLDRPQVEIPGTASAEGEADEG